MRHNDCVEYLEYSLICIVTATDKLEKRSAFGSGINVYAHAILVPHLRWSVHQHPKDTKTGPPPEMVDSTSTLRTPKLVPHLGWSVHLASSGHQNYAPT